MERPRADQPAVLLAGPASPTLPQLTQQGKNFISMAAKTGKIPKFVILRSSIQMRSELSLKKYSLFF
ncbi:MAG: hypothetical protein KDJ31_06415 [Candidatus Competibacteraceae bacterium]|nr:hypothetical protein [Candidatus Competibacteraceae bacterium]HRY14853.1 hypothetical protein [Candidatus Competibacteraceae bacterium]